MEKKCSKIARAALEIEREEAQRAGALGFMGRPFVMATLPHSRKPGTEYYRENGALRMQVLTPSRQGIPYGRYPRLLLSWLTTEACRKKDRRVELGHSLSSFMAQLGLMPTGGRHGTIPNLRRQMQSLFSSTILTTWEDSESYRHMGGLVASDAELWWDPKEPEQVALWGSWVELSTKFFDILVERPVPIDMRALKALRSPLALDLYAWLTYRNSYLRRPTLIPWELLHAQFGSDYGRMYDFKVQALAQLKNVLALYPDARVEAETGGLRLRPSPTHVGKLPTLP